jgi:type II secretory pathway component PulF
MTLSAALSIVALIAAVVLVFSAQTRVPAIVAILASGIQVLRAFHKMTLGLSHVSVDHVLAGVLLVAACWAFFRSSTKPAISASTAAALVGAVLLLQGLHLPVL